MDFSDTTQEAELERKRLPGSRQTYQRQKSWKDWMRLQRPSYGKNANMMLAGHALVGRKNMEAGALQQSSR